MLDLNILTVTGIGQTRRGLLLEVQSDAKIRALHEALNEVEAIKVTAFRIPTLLDRIALRHGKRLDMAEINPPTYRFIREELGVLVDFLGDTLLEGGNRIIGIRGMPRVGKTEAAIAACVYANKRWILLSSTIIRQTLRTELLLDESDNNIFLIDGITSTTRGNEAHWSLLERVLQMPTLKIIEHPDVFIRDGRLNVDFDFIIEIRHDENDVIRIEDIAMSFSSFELS
ncbi:ACT domain protein [Desulfosporosinus metallidurans]|uniref:ACT domain protein n=2 Tax=Desulfosporosinus metallidurans TaxID=1888891 RepID=A0A1Q8R2K8_9FIRM|nr:ACT domain protein [Desulfosporosinus metallidurans]